MKTILFVKPLILALALASTPALAENLVHVRYGCAPTNFLNSDFTLLVLEGADGAPPRLELKSRDFVLALLAPPAASLGETGNLLTSVKASNSSGVFRIEGNLKAMGEPGLSGGNLMIRLRGADGLDYQKPIHFVCGPPEEVNSIQHLDPSAKLPVSAAIPCGDTNPLASPESLVLKDLIQNSWFVAEGAPDQLSDQELADLVKKGTTFRLQDQPPLAVEMTPAQGSLRDVPISDLDAFLKKARAQASVRTVRTEAGPLVLDWNRSRIGDRVFYDVAKDVKAAQADHNQIGADQSDSFDEISEDYRPLSVAGPVLSYQQNEDSFEQGAAHPNAYVGWKAIDLRTGKPATLADVATKSSILQALKSDPYLKKIMRPTLRQKLLAASTYERAMKVLSEDLAGGLGDGDCVPEWSSDTPQAFAIQGYDAAKNELAVRIAISSTVHACGPDLKQLGLALTPTPAMKAQLLRMKQSGTGFFLGQ